MKEISTNTIWDDGYRGKIFVSHRNFMGFDSAVFDGHSIDAKQIKEYSHTLSERLKQHVNVFCDKDYIQSNFSFQPGDPKTIAFSQLIRVAIEQCDALVICISEEMGIEHTYTEYEWKMAQEMNKRIITVRFGDGSVEGSWWNNETRVIKKQDGRLTHEGSYLWLNSLILTLLNTFNHMNINYNS
jgi:hypothetical protein